MKDSIKYILIFLILAIISLIILFKIKDKQVEHVIIQDTTYNRIVLDSVVYNITRLDSIIYNIKIINEYEKNEALDDNDSMAVDRFKQLVLSE